MRWVSGVTDAGGTTAVQRCSGVGVMARHSPRASRPVPMTTPVILERPTGASLLAARVRDSLPQVGLIVLIALAAAAVVLARVIAP